jgi:ankyrin repeat protein
MFRGIPIDSIDNEGHTALHWAAYIGHEGLVRLLVKQQAHIDQQDDQGFTPLHWAASKGNRTVARTLIELGASTDLKVCTAVLAFCCAFIRECAVCRPLTDSPSCWIDRHHFKGYQQQHRL